MWHVDIIYTFSFISYIGALIKVAFFLVHVLHFRFITELYDEVLCVYFVFEKSCKMLQGIYCVWSRYLLKFFILFNRRDFWKLGSE